MHAFCACEHACLRVSVIDYVCVGAAGMFVYVCMYACMYVCMYACKYACILFVVELQVFLCMYVCMYACMYAFIVVEHACLRVRVHNYVCVGAAGIFVYVCMYACMYVCMYACRYACIL